MLAAPSSELSGRTGRWLCISVLALSVLLSSHALSAVAPTPLPHNQGAFLSPYSANGTLAGWVDEAVGESSRDISDLAGRLLQTALIAYGMEQSHRMNGLLDQASRASGVSIWDFGTALTAATPGNASAQGLEEITAMLSVLGSRGLIGERAGHQVQQLARLLEEPEAAMREELASLQIGSRDVLGVLRELEQLPWERRQGVLQALGSEIAPALELLLARDHNAGLFGAGEILQRQLSDSAVRQGAELGMGFFALFDGLSQTHRQLELTPERMIRLPRGRLRVRLT